MVGVGRGRIQREANSEQRSVAPLVFVITAWTSSKSDDDGGDENDTTGNNNS